LIISSVLPRLRKKDMRRFPPWSDFLSVHVKGLTRRGLSVKKSRTSLHFVAREIGNPLSLV
jgi:hypothetical protein